MKRSRSHHQSGLTLLEVILALAILAGAMAAIGELIRGGLKNADTARGLTRAELLCESVLSQIVAGSIAATATSNVPCEEDPRWLYTIATETGNQTGLLTVNVTVVQDVPSGQRPVQFSIGRWMVDPSVAASSTTTSQSESTTSSSSSSQNSTGGQP